MAISFPQVQVEYVQAKGGLNLVQPTIANNPGYVSDGLNFEVSQYGGYRRVAGYERFDGRPSPSAASYYRLPVTFSGVAAVGNTITGVTSSATAVIAAVTGDALIITKLSGLFNSSETLNISGSPVATTTDQAIAFGASTAYLDATYRLAAGDIYRSDIQAVPGSGSVRGVWFYNGSVYAFRNNAGGTACEMWKSSGSGWTAVSLGNEVSFTAGNASVGVGDTLTQGSVTATINAVVIESGSANAGTAAGRLIISAPSGGNFTSGAATSTGGGSLTLAGAQSEITLSPNGRYEFDNYSFTTTVKMYGCNGIDREFEFDGTTFVPLNTGGSVKGSFIKGHSNHLIIGTGASLTVSAIGNPYNYEVVNGAAEISVKDSVTSMLSQPGTNSTAALVVYTKQDSFILYGTSAADFQLVSYQNNVGALPYTGQSIGIAYSLDERGIIQIGASQNFGNFEHAAVSRLYTPFLDERRPSVIGSSVWRSKNQYRLYFSGGYALHITFDGPKTTGAIPVKFNHAATCVCTADSSSGEVGFFGSSDGYVYQMESGTSYDGAAIEAILRFPYWSAGSPRNLKTWKRGRMDVDFDGYASISLQPTVAYGSTESIQPDSQIGVGGSSLITVWDNGAWDFGAWDNINTYPVDFELSGVGETLGMTIYSSSAIAMPFVIQGFLVHYIVRRNMR